MKVAFIGSHGVGKTTLCFELAALLKKRDKIVEMVREVARFCPLPINRDTTIAAQSWILHTEIAEELVAEYKAEIVVCDRSVLDNYCYLLQTGRAPMLEPLVRWWTGTYQLLDQGADRRRPPVRRHARRGRRLPAPDRREDRRGRGRVERAGPAPRRVAAPAWAADSLDAVLPLLGPLQQPLFEGEPRSEV